MVDPVTQGRTGVDSLSRYSIFGLQGKQVVNGPGSTFHPYCTKTKINWINEFTFLYFSGQGGTALECFSSVLPWRVSTGDPLLPLPVSCSPKERSLPGGLGLRLNDSPNPYVDFSLMYFLLRRTRGIITRTNLTGKTGAGV